MRKIITILLMIFAFQLIENSEIKSQTQRNPLLEYWTGTWCGYCPCAHQLIQNTILPNYPNTVIIAYHGGDIFAFTDGNTIRSEFNDYGGASYPQGIIDRTSNPLSRGIWYNRIVVRNQVDATVAIGITKTFDQGTRNLDATVTVTPLIDLEGEYKLMVGIMENDIVYPQNHYSDCGYSGYIQNYVHEHVGRDYISGPFGYDLNEGYPWTAGVTAYVDVDYNVSQDWVSSNCQLVVFVYKVEDELEFSEVQQAEIWDLEGDITPVELSSFTSTVSRSGINLHWTTATETNNKGFEVERSPDGNGYEKLAFIDGNGTTSTQQNYSYLDNLGSNENGIYYYRLKQIDYDGTYDYSNVIAVKFDYPADFTLAQNYPNPFNPETVIKYSIPDKSPVKLVVYDLMGREIKVLVNEEMEPGSYEVNFDASELASGIYVYSLKAGEYTANKKMTVMK